MARLQLAIIMAARRGACCGKHGAGDKAAVGAAIDPVCGMSVTHRPQSTVCI